MLGKLWLRAWKYVRRSLLTAAAMAVFYVFFLLVGLVPLNRSFVPAVDGVPVYVLSSAVHADIVVPIDHSACDWRQFFPEADFKGDTAWATHVAIGWGDRGFYLETPTWDDLKASTALNAMLLPSGAVVHVSCTVTPLEHPAAHAIQLSNDQYADLCRSIQGSLVVVPDLDAKRIADQAYGDFDAFYEARGSYHCFFTCNSWVGRRLADAGVTTPMWTPLPGSPCWYLD